MLVNPNWYLTDTCISIYWLIIGLYSLIIGTIEWGELGWFSENVEFSKKK